MIAIVSSTTSKPDDVSWHEYLKGYGKLRWRRPGDEQRFHNLNGQLQPLYDLLCGNILDKTGPKVIVASRTPESVRAKGHAAFTFKAQCLITGRMSRAIPYERLIEFGVLTKDTADGGAFPQARTDIPDRISPIITKLQAECAKVAPYWDEPGTPWSERYTEYLRSDQWLALRALVLKRDGYRCQHTGKSTRPGDPLQVHHLTYARVGREELSDLTTLCRSAHRQLHGIATEPSERSQYGS